jgi:hypothetical protein
MASMAAANHGWDVNDELASAAMATLPTVGSTSH